MRQRLILSHHNTHYLFEQHCVLIVDVTLALQKHSALIGPLARLHGILTELLRRLAVDCALDGRQRLNQLLLVLCVHQCYRQITFVVCRLASLLICR